VDLFPEYVKKGIYLMGNIAMLIFFAVFFYHSINVVKGIALSGQRSTAMGLPMYVVYFSTSIGFALGTIRSLQVVFSQIVNFKAGSIATLDTGKKEVEEELANAKAELEKGAKKEVR